VKYEQRFSIKSEDINLQHEEPLELHCLELLDYIPQTNKRSYVVHPPEIIEVLIPQKLESFRKKHKRSARWNDKRSKISKKKSKNFISGRNYRVIEVPKTSGKKPKVEKRWQLLCNHCKVLFLARPTPKNSRYVVNHQCQPDGVRRQTCHQFMRLKRKQYIIGVKGRNCVLPHESACIQHVECFGDPDCH